MEKYDLKQLKKISNELKAEFAIGKNGITTTFIESIENYIRVHKLVKIKASLAQDKEEVKKLAEEISKNIDAELIDVRGYTFTIYKEKEEE